jgi:hypothetical protein
MRKLAVAAILAASMMLCSVSPSYADQEQSPIPLAFASEPSGDAVFTMIPAKFDAKGKVVSEPYGVMYRLQRNGALKEIYRIKGWYSWKVYVSEKGQYLVQRGPWNRGQRPEKDHLAVAFYKDGKLLKRYSTAELVKDHSKVRSSVSHYEWEAEGSIENPSGDRIASLTAGFSYDYTKSFSLHTIDGWTYSFDVETGNIRSSEKTVPLR